MSTVLNNLEPSFRIKQTIHFLMPTRWAKFVTLSAKKQCGTGKSMKDIYAIIPTRQQSQLIFVDVNTLGLSHGNDQILKRPIFQSRLMYIGLPQTFRYQPSHANAPSRVKCNSSLGGPVLYFTPRVGTHQSQAKQSLRLQSGNL